MFKILSANTFKRPVFAPDLPSLWVSFKTSAPILPSWLTLSCREAESNNHITNTIWGKKKVCTYRGKVNIAYCILIKHIKYKITFTLHTFSTLRTPFSKITSFPKSPRWRLLLFPNVSGKPGAMKSDLRPLTAETLPMDREGETWKREAHPQHAVDSIHSWGNVYSRPRNPFSFCGDIFFWTICICK